MYLDLGNDNIQTFKISKYVCVYDKQITGIITMNVIIY